MNWFHKLWRWLRPETFEETTARYHVILAEVEPHRATLRGLALFLERMEIRRAKIYELTDFHGLLIVVPPNTWKDLAEVLQHSVVPITCGVVVSPTLDWWECRLGEGIRLIPWESRQVPEYSPPLGT